MQLWPRTVITFFWYTQMLMLVLSKPPGQSA
jgi:hypothetical protein